MALWNDSRLNVAVARLPETISAICKEDDAGAGDSYLHSRDGVW